VGPGRTKQQISEIMRRVKSCDTTPELLFRKALWARGVRYKLHESGLPGRPDIVIPKARLVVFIDGDFWHGNQWRKRGHESLEAQFVASSNAEYWVGKIEGNMQRDRRNTAELLAQGWRTLRFWESEVATNPDRCVRVTLRAMAARGQPSLAARLSERTVVEFFAGIGLMRVALERKGWKVVFANDIDPEKRQMYRDNFPDCDEHFHLGDIHALSSEQVPSASLATASFPCNDLSVAGSMSGLNGKQSGAFWGMIRVLREMDDRKPPIVLLENVVGWLKSREGDDFADSLRALNGLGYTCDTFMIDAAHFVPQSRPRLFVVGILDEVPVPHAYGNPAFHQSRLRPKSLTDFIIHHPDIDWRIRALPSLPSRASELTDILEDLPDDSPEWWSAERAAYFLNQMSERHSRIARLMIRDGNYTYGTAFRRVRHGKSMAELRVDGIAGCLRTPRGGSGRQILFKAGRGRYFVRLLTPRECARLQGVPDSFKIDAPLNQALFGFGDAVCVPAIEWIADNYLNPLVTEVIHGQALYPGNAEPASKVTQ